MKVIITGSREWSKDLSPLVNFLMDLPKDTTIIHGDAHGIDSYADHYAKNLGLQRIKVPANWDRHGRSAGPIRNILMLDMFPDAKVVYFQENNSRGTQHMIDTARARGFEVINGEKRE